MRASRRRLHDHIADRVNLNTASAEELMTLPTIGSARAAAIISSRDEDGPFTSVDDLKRIHGIGKGMVTALRYLTKTRD